MSKIQEKYEAIVDQMEWYALYMPFDNQKVEQFNIFENIHFYDGIVELLKRKKGLTFEEFVDVVRKEAMYAFWSKCEYEVIVRSWPPRRVYRGDLNHAGLTIELQWFATKKENLELEAVNRKAIEDNKMKFGRYYLQHEDDVHDFKIDVYEQLKPNLERIAEYIIKVSGYRVKKEKKEEK